ncbi:hypothetical protein JL101_035550 (plasmid) [Skermanella rosea]|uniref:SPFH domain-containing protein n=1 Tax=Skermanella rosea TaxID=1817965 RepID=UPI001932383B|nr:SPFH domain-containing protein [Skermanella rosea]UEM08115.1 hypothetical protein JL101_035550 [Skermanella rosea]
MTTISQGKNLVRKVSIAVGVFLTLVVGLLASQLFQTNNAGYVQVKQAAGSGQMSVRTQPGVYLKMFADIHEYRISDVYDFNAEDERIPVRFNDASTAFVSGQIKFRLPMTEQDILNIHQDFRSFEAVQSDLVRQVVAASLKQSATHFGAEEVYSTRRSDFINLVNEQIKNGIYATEYEERWRKDEDGNSFIERLVKVRLREDGKPFIAEPSTFDRYNVELVQLVINDIDFDEKTDELIAKRKEAEQEQVVAKANAERAKQDAITAQERGKANVAQAEAESLVEKKRAVIAAEKEREVAEEQALKAEEEKKAIIARGEAEARANALKVSAGLTPQEKAQFAKETAIGVAAELAKVKLPGLMVIGGQGQSGQVNPFDAVGLESFIRISKGLSKGAANE